MSRTIRYDKKFNRKLIAFVASVETFALTPGATYEEEKSAPYQLAHAEMFRTEEKLIRAIEKWCRKKRRSKREAKPSPTDHTDHTART